MISKIGKSFVIGLTGQSGSGKTMVSDYLSCNGFCVINADVVARSVTAKGSDCNKRLKELFPDCVDDALVLDRKKLGALVFSNVGKLRMLNDTIFPYINQCICDEITMLTDNGGDIIVLDAPTLFEAGADKLCDAIVSVVADDDVRLERIIRRDSLSEERAKERFASQHTKDYYIAHSDYIIENNGSAQELLSCADRVFNAIKEQIDDLQKD